MLAEMAKRLSEPELRLALADMAHRADMIVMSRSEHEALMDAREALAELIAHDRIVARLDAGEEELLPVGLVDRLLSGENPIRVFREHRGISGAALAERAGVSASYLSEIERGVKPGSVVAVKAIADALGVAMDDLI